MQACIQSIRSFQLVCGADIDELQVEQFSKMWGIERYMLIFSKWLQTMFDVISVCTHPDVHHKIVKALLGKVKVVFCEKPFMRNSDEIKDLINCARPSTTKYYGQSLP